MTDTESIVDHIMKTAERNERISREIRTTRRLIWLIATAAFCAGWVARGWMQ